MSTSNDISPAYHRTASWPSDVSCLMWSSVPRNENVSLNEVSLGIALKLPPRSLVGDPQTLEIDGSDVPCNLLPAAPAAAASLGRQAALPPAFALAPAPARQTSPLPLQCPRARTIARRVQTQSVKAAVFPFSPRVFPPLEGAVDEPWSSFPAISI